MLVSEVGYNVIIPSTTWLLSMIFICSSVNDKPCFYIFRRKIVIILQATSLTASGYIYWVHTLHDATSSLNKFLYFMEMISVNLVRQYKDWPFNVNVSMLWSSFSNCFIRPLTNDSISKIPCCLDWKTMISSENLPNIERATSDFLQVSPLTASVYRASHPEILINLLRSYLSIFNSTFPL